MATLSPFPSSKVQIRAIRSANWTKVAAGKGLASMVSKLETTAYPALLFPSKTKLLPSVYLISSELVRGSSENPSRYFFFFPLPVVQGFLERVKGKRALGGRQEGAWVKNLTKGYSQVWIFYQHYLISENPLI